MPLSSQSAPQAGPASDIAGAAEEKERRDTVVAEILALEAKIWDADHVAALDFLRQAVRRHPHDLRLTARLAIHAGWIADWRDGPLDIAGLVASGKNLLPPLWAMMQSEDRALHRAAAANHAAHAPLPAAPAFVHEMGRPKPKLRIGYISPDFRDHAMSQCVAEVFERHDRNRVEIIGYALRADDRSDLRKRIEAGFDRFIDLSGASEAEAAARIQADGIDILVDLIGYNTFQGYAIFAARPAPVQVSLLGFPGTKTLPSIDYFIGDAIVCGDDAAEHFTEKLVLLPETYYPTDLRKSHFAAEWQGGERSNPCEPAHSRESGNPATWSPLSAFALGRFGGLKPTEARRASAGGSRGRAEWESLDYFAEARAAAGLPHDAFVFCCFNLPSKFTPPLFDVWMRILRRADGAVLWLLDMGKGVPENLRREAHARGIDPARLIFAPHLPPAEYTARLQLADLALDTLPCGAHTTAVDALWAGVPMLTCLGKSFAGRVGASLLNAIGLPELIARDWESYEATAVRLVQEPDVLASLRQRLATNRTTYPLFDCARYTWHLETAYETMWAIHCQGDGPRAFGVLPTRHCRA